MLCQATHLLRQRRELSREGCAGLLLRELELGYAHAQLVPLLRRRLRPRLVLLPLFGPHRAHLILGCLAIPLLVHGTALVVLAFLS
jgi:hypothetical protein